MWRRRCDGDMARGVDVTRRAMPYFMRGRNEAAVYFEYDVGLRQADAFVREWNEANPLLRVDVFHLALWALGDALARNPSSHRFVVGGRLYDRRGVWLSYAVKTRLETGAPFVTVKRRFDLDETFGAMVEGVYAQETQALSGERSTLERELGLLLRLPGFARRIVMAVIRALDRFGMLPRGYIEKDPMYTSAFVANMASIGMPAVYHHLYEYGTASIFCSLGRPVPEPGSPTSGPERRRRTTLKFTYDERADDGLVAWFALRRIKQVLENPSSCGLTVEHRANGAERTTAPPAVDRAIDPAHAPVESSS